MQRKLKATATPSTASQMFFEALPAAVKASERCRRASTSPKTDNTGAASAKASSMSHWRLPKMFNMHPAYGADPEPQVDDSSARSDPDGVDRPDLLTVAEHRSVGQLVENLCVDPQSPQRCCHHDGPGALPTIGDLECDRAAVGQAHAIDRLRAVLGDQAGHTSDQCGDVTSRPSQPLWKRPHRGRHPDLIGALGSNG